MLETGNKPVKGGGEGGRGVATFLLLYSSIIFAVYEGKVRFPLYFLAVHSIELAMQDSDCTKLFIVLKPNIICTFLIDYGSVQKMLTAFFNFVWNTQKNKWIIFLTTQARCFLVLKRFLKR